MHFDRTPLTFCRKFESQPEIFKLFFGENASVRYFSGAFSAPLGRNGGGVFRFSMQERGNICI